MTDVAETWREAARLTREHAQQMAKISTLAKEAGAEGLDVLMAYQCVEFNLELVAKMFDARADGTTDESV